MKGVSSKFVESLKDIYEGSKFRIRLNGVGEKTKIFQQKLGVRQGCNLSPLLFILYIDNVINEERFINTHSPCIGNVDIPGVLYADDICLMAFTKIGLQKKLDYVSEFCTKWDLKINVNKSKVLVGSKGCKFSKTEKWFIEGKELERVNQFKYLGVIINHDGKWNMQKEGARIIGNNAFNVVTNLKGRIKSVKSNIIMNVYKSMVESRLLYGVEVWGGVNTEDLIDKMRAKVAKVILNAPRYTANDAARCELGLDSGLGEVVVRILKYYNYIMGKEDNEVVKICLVEYIKDRERYKSVNRGGNEIKELLSRWGPEGKKVEKG